MGQQRHTNYHGLALTSPANIGSMTAGEMFVGAVGDVYVVLFNDQQRQGAQVLGMHGQAAVVGADGEPTRGTLGWACSPNMPVDRIVGARPGGLL